jgi:hypothetical protein
VVYRAGEGRGAPVPRYTIATVGKIAPERARARAKVILGFVAHGHDPADQKTTERGTPTVAELADRFMAEHVEAKRKAGTAKFYRDILDRIVKPEVGTTKADKLTRFQVGRLHSSLAETPFQANRMLAVVGSMYAFAARAGIVPEAMNPARRIDKFKESRRERFLTKVRTNRALPPSTFQRPSALPRSPRRRRRRCGCFSSLAAACGKFWTCDGTTLIWNAVVCFCPTARAAEKR